MKVLIFSVLFISQSLLADVYMHMPRGSNSRLKSLQEDINTYNECQPQQSFECARYGVYRGQYYCAYYIRTETVTVECQ